MRVVVVSAPAFLVPVVVGVVVVAGGCTSCWTDEIEKDRTPPRVVAIAPNDPVVPVDVSLRVTFSERVEQATVSDDPIVDDLSVALVARADATESFISDFKNGGTFLESRHAKLLPVDIDFDGEAVTVTPLSPLEARTAFTLLLGSSISDGSRNPLVDGSALKADFRYDFETDGGQPVVVDVDVEAPPGLVAPNRRRIVITFNQPVQNVGNDTVTLAPSVTLEAILLDEARTSATLFIAPADDASCERLAPSTTYTLSVSDGVVADTGQQLAPFSTTFASGGACDTVPNLIVDGPDAIAGELAATIRFETTKPSTTEVRFGVVGGALDCLGAPCPVSGTPSRTAITGSSPPRFLHSIDVVGLTLDTRYRVVVSAEDDVGNTASGDVEFVTAPLPRVALNEVMANPSSNPEGQGEYVELVNFGDVEVDVSGWQLIVNNECTAVLPDALVMPAGAFVVVAGAAFVEAAYDLTGDVRVIKLVTGTGANAMCGLVNSGASLLLTDGDGRPVSSISNHPSTVARENGVSVERTSPEASDVAESFCLARDGVIATPGRANSVTVGGCG